MDTLNTDKLFQFIIAVASQIGDSFGRRLQPIHLLKYAYLADLAYAERHGGKTFTGIPWRFYHFGPWDEEAYRRIEPSLLAIGASFEIVESDFGDRKDRIKWSWDGSGHDFEHVKRDIPAEIKFLILKYVRNFGGFATYDLLHLVYSTKPMVLAAPGEYLDFGCVQVEETPLLETTANTLTARQKKKRSQKLAEFRDVFRARAARKMELAKQQQQNDNPPIYDDVFFEGLACFDTMGAVDLSQGRCTLGIDPAVWKSGSRENPDVS